MSSKPSGAADGGKKAQAPAPNPAPVRPPPKKLKPVAVNDIIVEGIVPLNDAFVAAPVLTEDHMYVVEARVKDIVKSQQHMVQQQAMIAAVAKAAALSRPLSATAGASLSSTAAGGINAVVDPSSMPPTTVGAARSPGTTPLQLLPPSAASPSPPTGRALQQHPQQQISPHAYLPSSLPPRTVERFTALMPESNGNGSPPTAAPPPSVKDPAYAAHVAASQAEKALVAYPAEDAAILRLMAFRRVVHQHTSLRVHEELSRNLRVNIADLALVERVLFELWEKEHEFAGLLALSAATNHNVGTPYETNMTSPLSPPAAATAGSSFAYFQNSNVSKVLPPVCVLVLFLWTCDSRDLSMIFFAETTSTAASGLLLTEQADRTDATGAAATAPAINTTTNNSNNRKMLELVAARRKAEETRQLLVTKVRERLQEAQQAQQHHHHPQQHASGEEPNDDATLITRRGGAPLLEDFSRGQRLLTEMKAAMQLRGPQGAYAMNKWCGTLSVLLATLHLVHELTSPKFVVAAPSITNTVGSSYGLLYTSMKSAGGGATSAEAPFAGTNKPSSAGGLGSMGAVGSVTSRPASSRSHKSLASSLTLQEDVSDKLVLRARLEFPSTADALAALERFATAAPEGFPVVSLPPLLSFTASPQLIPPVPHVSLRRHEDYVMPNLDIDESTNTLRSFEEKMRLLCEGWYVAPKPVTVPEDAAATAATAAAAAGANSKKSPPDSAPGGKKPPTPGGGKKKRGNTPGGSGELVPITPENEGQYLQELPTYITIEVVVNHATDHVIDLRNFITAHPDDFEFLLPPLLPLRHHMIIPEKLKWCLRIITGPSPHVPRSDTISIAAAAYFERIVSDGRKASAVAAKICARLQNQFVRPHHCHRHPSQAYAAFCCDCRCFICSACMTENHSAHRFEGISAVCHELQQRMIAPKVADLQERAALLRKLLQELPQKAHALHRLVDRAIDDVKVRVDRCREQLHSDVTAREELQRGQLLVEQDHAKLSLEEKSAKFTALSVVRFGSLPESVVSWKPLISRQVLDWLSPRLPTRQVCSMIRVLTWSNASKYLIHVVYPPKEIHGAAHGDDVSHEVDDVASHHHNESSTGGTAYAPSTQSSMLSHDTQTFLSGVHVRQQQLSVCASPLPESYDGSDPASFPHDLTRPFVTEREGQSFVADRVDVALANCGKRLWSEAYRQQKSGEVARRRGFDFLQAQAKQDARTRETRDLAARMARRESVNAVSNMIQSIAKERRATMAVCADSATSSSPGSGSHRPTMTSFAFGEDEA